MITPYKAGINRNSSDRHTRHFKYSTTPLISVVICTYNRADLLADVLTTLHKQKLDKSHYEVIVVDNNSEDNTRTVVKEFCQYFSTLRYCLEKKQGLSHARNHGWQMAKGEYVAYIDDDCKIPEQWLSIAKDIIKRFSPGVFGGPFYAFYNSKKPKWYKDSYGSHEPFKEARILSGPESLKIYGGNIFFRKELLQTTGGFDVKFGMSGRKIGYGEETALLSLIYETMPDQLIYYEPRLRVYHLVQAKKMSVCWIIRSFFTQGRHSSYYNSNLIFYRTALPIVGKPYLFKAAVRTCITLFLKLVNAAFRRDRMRYVYFQNYLYERTYQDFFKLGKLFEQHQQFQKHR